MAKDDDVALPALAPSRARPVRQRSGATSRSTRSSAPSVPNNTVMSTSSVHPLGIPIPPNNPGTGRVKKSSTGSAVSASTVEDSPPRHTPPTTTFPIPSAASSLFRSKVDYYRQNLTSRDSDVEDIVGFWISGAKDERSCQKGVDDIMRLLYGHRSRSMAGVLFRQDFSLDNIAVEGGCGMYQTKITQTLHNLRQSIADKDPSSTREDKSSVRVPDHAIFATGDFRTLVPTLSTLPSNRETGSHGSRSVTPSIQSRKRKREPHDPIEGQTFCTCGLLIEDKPQGRSPIKALGQMLCYAVAAYEMCGCKLGLVVMGATFTRLVVKDDRTIYIESIDSGTPIRAPMSISDYIKKQKEYQHFHKLGLEEGDNANGEIEYQMDHEAIDRLIDIIKTGFDSLLDLRISGVHRNELLARSYDFANNWHQALVETEQDRATIIASARPELRQAATALGSVPPGRGKKDEDEDQDGLGGGEGGDGAEGPPSGSGVGDQGGARGPDETKDDNNQGGSPPGRGSRFTQAGTNSADCYGMDGDRGNTTSTQDQAGYGEDHVALQQGCRASDAESVVNPSDVAGSTDEDEDGEDNDDEERYFAFADTNLEALSLLSLGLIVVNPSTMDKLVKSVCTPPVSHPVSEKGKVPFHDSLHSQLRFDLPQFGRYAI